MGLVGTVRLFNKAGARLIQRIAKTPLEDEVFVMDNITLNAGKKIFHGVTPPKGAVTGSFVEGEKAFGKEGFQIISFFDDSGKLIQRHRFSSNQTQLKPTLSSISDYSSRVIGSRDNKVTDELFRTHTRQFNLNGDVIADASRGLQLNYSANFGTTGVVTNCTLKKNAGIVYTEAGRNPNNPATKHLADSFDFCIKELGHSTSKKSYNGSIFYEPSTGTFHSLSGKGTNLTAEELEILNSDKYLGLRLHGNINRCEYLKKDAYANQGIPIDTPVEYKEVHHLGTGANASRKRIEVEYLGKVEELPVNLSIDNLNHEARHVPI